MRVKDGFPWAAFCGTWVWADYNKMWNYAGVYALALLICSGVAAGPIISTEQLIIKLISTVAILSLNVYYGIQFNKWHGEKLESMGFVKK